MTATPAEVAIIYRFLPQWRVDFFCGLREALASDNIRLRLFYGKNSPEASGKPAGHRLKWGNEVDLEWGTAVPNRLWNIWKYELVWQRLPNDVFAADLIILMQENSLLSNYTAGLKRMLRGKKVALWGHGLNHQEDARSVGNLFKRFYSTRVDWWFAYTPSVADHLLRLGFPAERITVVNNAIDTMALIAEAQNIVPDQLSSLRGDLGLGDGPVGIFCGGMYPDKELNFLAQACDRIREHVPGFEVLFLGTGSDASIVQRFAEGRQWAHYVGPCYGASRVPYFMISDVFLMPGVVGLAILDCFALETPLLTTNNPRHGPEISYLEAGIDGIVSENSLESYISAVVGVLRSEETLRRLKLGCRQKAGRYTLHNMVDEFSRGVQNALASP